MAVPASSTYSEQWFPLVIEVADNSSRQYFKMPCISRAIDNQVVDDNSHLLGTLSKRVASGNVAKYCRYSSK